MTLTMMELLYIILLFKMHRTGLGDANAVF